MANYTKLTDLFTGIANAIRSKTGGSSEIIADNFPSEISGIVTVQEGTADATASASNIDSGMTAYVNGAKVTGTSTKVDTSDATATASDIASGKTAYVNGQKLTGTAVTPNLKMVAQAFQQNITNSYSTVFSAPSDLSDVSKVKATLSESNNNEDYSLIFMEISTKEKHFVKNNTTFYV